MLNSLKSLLELPITRHIDIDDPETGVRRATIIQQKPFLRQLYEHWYGMIAAALPVSIDGPVLEAGSGGGFMKRFIPELITSEIHYLPTVDIIADGQSLPFARSSLRSVVMVDVLHHLPDVKAFFREAAFCVKPGGAVIMIEPWVTPWSRFIYRYLHHEPFVPEAEQWAFPKGGPLSQANSALPWIVFERDRRQFDTEFPEWRVAEIRLHTPFSYLLSGGVSLRSLVPGPMFQSCQQIEARMKPLMRSWAMFALIVLMRN